ncbi:MAG: FMN-binding protein [Prolixibacteraceae bacterium]|nr:FMN-binding protein [Prolixibacteraceae bacterium]
MVKSVLLVLVVLSSFVFPPKGIDFGNKTLLKEIQKANGAELPERKEISILPSMAETNVLQGKFFELNSHNQTCKYVYIGRVNGCRQGGCSNSSETSLMETSEYFDYFILFDSNLTVQQVKVYDYQASHGQEITNKGWLKQFQGYNGSRSLLVGKSIDAISGATVSAVGITTDIQEKTKLLKHLLEAKK